MVTMRFEGGKELAAALASLPKRVSRSMVKDTLLSAAEPMARRAGSLARRAPGKPDIADNIVVTATRRSQDLAGMNAATAQAVAYGPAKGFYYGHFLEYGTARMGAFPYMRPSFDAGVDRALAYIRDALWVELAGRGVRRGTINAPSVPQGEV